MENITPKLAKKQNFILKSKQKIDMQEKGGVHPLGEGNKTILDIYEEKNLLSEARESRQENEKQYFEIDNEISFHSENENKNGHTGEDMDREENEREKNRKIPKMTKKKICMVKW